MNQLISHIEFLLHEHNCVIVPDLGGFVVNTIPARRNGISEFRAPMCELVFNRDLTHNDGLLAQSYMKAENLSFEAASRRVETAVRELNRQLSEQHSVNLGKLGSFTINEEKRLIYTPASFVRPALFGLTKASLKPMIQVQPAASLVEPAKKKSLVRSISVGTVAAAVIALLLLVFPIEDSVVQRQSAQMLSESGFFRRNADRTPDRNTTTSVSDREMLSGAIPQPADEPVQPSADAPSGTTIESDAAPRYYIITGVYEVPEIAAKSMETLKNKGFRDVSSLKRSGRTDVYVASFTNRTDAAAFLKKFHMQHPNHRDAWVLER